MSNVFRGTGCQPVQKYSQHSLAALSTTPLRLLFIGLIVSMVAACSPQHRTRSASLPAPVTHIVVCWLKTPGSMEQARQVIETSKSFADLPGVRSVRVGERLRLPTTRPIDETSFDIALVMTFDSPEALRDYQLHPNHEAAVREVLRPMTRRILIYDFLAE